MSTRGELLNLLNCPLRNLRTHQLILKILSISFYRRKKMSLLSIITSFLFCSGDHILCPKTSKGYYNFMWIGKEKQSNYYSYTNLENTNCIDDLLKLITQFSKLYGYKIIIHHYIEDNCIYIHQQQTIKDYNF